MKEMHLRNRMREVKGINGRKKEIGLCTEKEKMRKLARERERIMLGERERDVWKNVKPCLRRSIQIGLNGKEMFLQQQSQKEASLNKKQF